MSGRALGLNPTSTADQELVSFMQQKMWNTFFITLGLDTLKTADKFGQTHLIPKRRSEPNLVPNNSK